MIIKRKKPTFKTQYSHIRIAIKNKPRWRRPYGIYSKQAMGIKWKGAVPKPGYGQPKAIRYKHPCGLYETLIKHVSQLNDVNPKTHAIRLSATLGVKKRLEIIKAAEEKKLKILNKAKKYKKKVVKPAKKAEEKKEEKKTEVKKEAVSAEPKK